MFGTVKETWLYGLDLDAITSIESFNKELAEFVRKYNLSVHSATGETPIDRYLKTRERIKAPQSFAWLQECFLHRERRKVRNDSTIVIQKMQFDCPMHFIGQTVEVRFSPDQPDDAFILFDKKRYPLRKTNKAENSRTKRSAYRIDYGVKGGADIA